MNCPAGSSPDVEPKASFFLVEPFGLLRSIVSGWSFEQGENVTGEVVDGLCEALLLGLECAGYPLGDLHKGLIELAVVDAEKGGGQPVGGAEHGLLVVYQAMNKSLEDKLRAAKFAEIKAVRALNHSQLLHQLEMRGMIE